MRMREVVPEGVRCHWCQGSGCLVCAPERAKRAKEIVLHIQVSGEELDELLAKINGAVLRTTQVLVYATYASRSRDYDAGSEHCTDDEDDDSGRPDPPEIRAMRRELVELIERTPTSWTRDRISEIERAIASHANGVESLKRLFATAEPTPEPEPPEWIKKPKRKRNTAKAAAANG